MSVRQLLWYNKEDNWANVIGISLVVVISIAWCMDMFHIFDIFRVQFTGWSGLAVIKSLQNTHFLHIVVLWIVFMVLFAVVARYLERDVGKFIVGFNVVYCLSLLVGILSTQSLAKEWQLEMPLVALLLGLILSNTLSLPQWFKDTFLTEFYVKIGIVLMGATLPVTLLFSAGSVAIMQACIVTIITFFSIFFVATKFFGLPAAFGATLGAGGSICGVSAAIVIGNASGAQKEHVSVAISIVVFWAVIMIFVLPLLCHLFGLDMGVAGAWIGTSEFADAAGLAAAQGLGDERAVAAFTLIKVIGRDMFVGVWAVLVALLSAAVWHKSTTANVRISSRIIWERFPKFILGFMLASVIGTMFVSYLPESTHKAYQAEALGFVKELRNWVFTWTFLCIGLSTEFKKIIRVGFAPFIAFSIGVAINLPLGFFLSNYMFVDFWRNFMR
ncbi:putative sulfate exporter family transporter [Helicobacter aurati]|uniref:Putative sulfate exporter family transporter n=1 Tax=Helicobacter aurati TaxID=137778 RepID=A0A3D8J5B2_9HELI|nr:putative sulfate exporter family transporter [Helicobacter aurati]RDU72376.1 putative sulfate exporter family transporter [Helicobacter aurati]